MLMKKNQFLSLICMIVSASALTSKAQGQSTQVKTITVKHSSNYMESLKKYPVCKVDEIGKKLASGNNIYKTSFPTRHITDEVAAYSFYAVTENDQLNADRIRLATCKHIIENACHVFWGNTLNMAYLAERPTAAFPFDTTPSHLISPEITCDSINFTKIEKKENTHKAKKTTGFQINL